MSWDNGESTFNWSEMQSEATTILEGEFPVQVVKSEAVKTSNGKDMIKVKFKVETGQFAGRALFTNFVVSPESLNAMRMFFTQLAVFGLNSQFFASINGQGPAAIAAALDGRKAIAIVGKGVYQGQEREQINGYKPALGGHGGGTFVAGLGVGIGIGAGASSSPFGSPSPSSFNSPLGGTVSEPMLTSASTSPADAGTALIAQEPKSSEEPVSTEPSTPPPVTPAF